MNWIKDKDTSKIVRKIFSKKILPLSKKLQKEGKTFFPLKPNPNARTYYIKREKTSMVPEDFEVSGCDSFNSLEKYLKDLWESDGYSEICSLAKTSSELSKLLYFIEEENEEISQFIYVMF